MTNQSIHLLLCAISDDLLGIRACLCISRVFVFVFLECLQTLLHFGFNPFPPSLVTPHLSQPFLQIWMLIIFPIYTIYIISYHPPHQLGPASSYDLVSEELMIAINVVFTVICINDNDYVPRVHLNQCFSQSDQFWTFLTHFVCHGSQRPCNFENTIKSYNWRHMKSILVSVWPK